MCDLTGPKMRHIFQRGAYSQIATEVVMSNPSPVFSRNTGQNYSKSEQRRSQRHACKIAAGWRLLGAPDLRFIPGTVQDISRNGFAIRVKTECKRGAIISIRLESE